MDCSANLVAIRPYYFHGLPTSLSGLRPDRSGFESRRRSSRAAVILPAGNRAKLHAQRHTPAQRFDSEDTRPSTRTGEHEGSVRSSRTHAFQRRGAGSDELPEAERYPQRAGPNPGLRFATWRNFAIGNADQSAMNIADHRAAEREVFDAAYDAPDSHVSPLRIDLPRLPKKPLSNREPNVARRNRTQVARPRRRNGGEVASELGQKPSGSRRQGSRPFPPIPESCEGFVCCSRTVRSGGLRRGAGSKRRCQHADNSRFSDHGNQPRCSPAASCARTPNQSNLTTLGTYDAVRL